jgi:hypothetical protein
LGQSTRWWWQLCSPSSAWVSVAKGLHHWASIKPSSSWMCYLYALKSLKDTTITATQSCRKCPSCRVLAFLSSTRVTSPRHHWLHSVAGSSTCAMACNLQLIPVEIST